MPKLPFISQQANEPENPRLRWRVFGRVLMVFAVVAGITALSVMLAQRVVHPRAVAGAAGLIAGLGGSAVSALLWSWRVARRVQGIARVIESGAPIRPEDYPGDVFDILFAEVLPAWHDGIRVLQTRWQEKQEEANRSNETLSEFIRMIAKAVDERAAYLRGHSERVAGYSVAIARQMGVEETKVERIRLAALLHDIGTLGIEDYLVSKETPLTAEEFEIMKAHTVKGAAILRPIAQLQDLIPGVELHHESLDGTGYPYGLEGGEIPLMARIIAVADSFDAMTTHRPYQAAMHSAYVLEVMDRLTATRYDRNVVTALAVLVRGGAVEVKNLRTPVSFRMRKPAADPA